MVSSINNGNHLVSGSNLVQHPPTIISSTAEVEFLFCAGCACYTV